MRRRRLLQTACASVASFAGCSSLATEPESPASTKSAKPTKSTKPTASTSPVSAYGCPPYGSSLDGFVCSHTVDTESANVYLLPSKTRADASPETVELTLYNKSSAELKFNPYQWSIMMEKPSGWESLEKHISGNAKLTISSGDTHAWTFGEVVDFINEQATLEEGTYTAAISVPNPDGSDWIQCLALIHLI